MKALRPSYVYYLTAREPKSSGEGAILGSEGGKSYYVTCYGRSSRPFHPISCDGGRFVFSSADKLMHMHKDFTYTAFISYSAIIIPDFLFVHY